MSEIYKGFELNEYLQSDWYAVENALMKDIIDLLPDNGDTLVTTQHTHSKLVAGDEDPDPALMADDAGNIIIGSGLAEGLALLHLYAGDSGYPAPRVVPTGTVAVLESDGSVYLTFLAPVGGTVYRGVYFGDDYANDRGRVVYRSVGTTGTYYDELRFYVAGLADYHMMLLNDSVYGPAMALIDALDILGGGDGSGTLRILAGGAVMDFGIGTANQVTFSSTVSGDAGSGGELVMHSRTTNTGCKVNSDGDLQMDADEYFRAGHTAPTQTNSSGNIVYSKAGSAALDRWVPIKDATGAVVWVVGTTSDQSAA